MANAKSDICAKLLASYQPEQALKSRKEVSVLERGVHYKTEIVPQRKTVVFQIDGDIIQEGKRCDKLILAKDSANGSLWTGCFVELKGSDVESAIDQLERTITHQVFNDPTLQKKFARIVSSAGMPANNGHTKIEKAKIKFRQKYGCELRRLRSKQLDNI